MDMIEKLEKWIEENPDAADAPTINITTGKEFTVRQVLDQLKKAKAEDVEIVDAEVLAITSQIEEWLREV